MWRVTVFVFGWTILLKLGLFAVFVLCCALSVILTFQKYGERNVNEPVHIKHNLKTIIEIKNIILKFLQHTVENKGSLLGLVDYEDALSAMETLWWAKRLMFILLKKKRFFKELWTETCFGEPKVTTAKFFPGDPYFNI